MSADGQSDNIADQQKIESNKRLETHMPGPINRLDLEGKSRDDDQRLEDDDPAVSASIHNQSADKLVAHHTPHDRDDVLRNRLDSIFKKDQAAQPIQNGVSRDASIDARAELLNSTFRSGTFDVMETSQPRSFYRSVQVSGEELDALRTGVSNKDEFKAAFNSHLLEKATDSTKGTFFTSEQPTGHLAHIIDQAVAPEWRAGGVNHTDSDGFTAIVQVDVPAGQEYFKGPTAHQGAVEIPSHYSTRIAAGLVGGGEQIVMIDPQVTGTSIVSEWGNRPDYP